jgi:outer membrane protein assembly factor BamB
LRGGSRIWATLVAISVVALVAPSQVSARTTRVYDVSNTPERAEGEETVAINPKNAKNIIVGSNQWLPSTPGNLGNIGIGANGIVSCAEWSSHNGGRTWSGGRLENSGLETLTGPLPQLVQQPREFGDPDVGNLISADQNTVFDRHGNAYFQCVNSGAGTGDVKVYVYRSSDGGRTWSSPVAAFSETNTQIQIDRPYLAIDNSRGPRDGTLYLTYETMFYQAYLPEVFSETSTDGGRTWSAPVRVDEGGANAAQWDPRQYPVVGADGTLYVVYDAATFVSPAPIDPQLTPLKLMIARSRDGGHTFSNALVEPSVTRIQSPDEAFSYFTETISAIATDPSHPGRVAVAWPDKRSGDARILLRYSLDGGNSFSPIIDVPDDPVGDGNQHDHVALTYTPDGRLIVVWRDRRASGGAFGGALDVFARAFDPSADGHLTPGATVRVTTSSQPDGQNTHGNMPTEYLGVASNRAGVDVSWNELRGTFLDNVFRQIPVSAFG